MTIKFACKKVSSPVAYCALSVKTGTRYEEPQYNGLAHLIEHMLFKGTAKRTSNSINRVLENEGGELNAYTTKEEIVLYSTVLREDLSKAIDLISELALTSIFPTKELEKELDVIYDEIISYKDSPSESIYDHFETLLFKGHPLEKPILGEKKTLRKIDSAILKEFLNTNFKPHNMFFTVVGDIQEKELQKMVQKSISKYYKFAQETEQPATEQQKAETDIVCALAVHEEQINSSNYKTDYTEDDKDESLSKGNTTSNTTNDNVGKDNAANYKNSNNSLEIGNCFAIEVAKRNHQAHCIIGCSAYSYYDGWKRTALALLTNILGGPASGSRLNMTLREKHALVYNIDASYTPYSDTGIFSIYFGCDKSLLEKCKELVYSQLEKIVSSPLSERELKNAKKQFLGQLFISQDNAEAQCLAMGKSLLVYERIYPFEQTKMQINSITSAQLQQVAREILNRNRLSELVYK